MPTKRGAKAGRIGGRGFVDVSDAMVGLQESTRRELSTASRRVFSALGDLNVAMNALSRVVRMLDDDKARHDESALEGDERFIPHPATQAEIALARRAQLRRIAREKRLPRALRGEVCG